MRLAGQITGVEGYLESAATGLAIGLYLALERQGRTPEPFPATTALGALARHLTESDPKHFQPANINYGLFEELPEPGPARPTAAPPTPSGPAADSTAWAERPNQGVLPAATPDASPDPPLPGAPRRRAQRLAADPARLRARPRPLPSTSSAATTWARTRSRRARGGGRPGRALLPRRPDARGLGKRSQGRALSAVRSLFRFACREGTLAANPAQAVRTPKVPKTLPRHLRPGEVENLLEAPAAGPTSRCARATGPSWSCSTPRACASASWWASTGRTSTSRPGCCGSMGKGSKERMVPFGRPAADALRRWLEVWEASRSSGRRGG